MTAAIDVTDLSYRVGRKDILAGVSLSVSRGEYVAIIGPNGAGKTTLLKCLNGILAGWHGSVHIMGKPAGAYSQHELARQIAYVPQSAGKHPFTVFEYVLMGRYPYLSPFSSVGKDDEDAVRAALELTGTARFADRRHGTLSGGERQKVVIAAALAQDANILLLDEPTTFLDPRHQSDISRILARANRDKGVTVISVTHDINAAVLSSNRIVALKEGRVLFSGPAHDVLDNDVLRDLYDMEFAFTTHPVSGRRIIAPEESA